VRYLRRLPALLTAAFQAVNAWRCGDLRFAAYLQMYPVKVLRTLQRAAPAPKGATGNQRQGRRCRPSGGMPQETVDSLSS
jgi:hypothetical protein